MHWFVLRVMIELSPSSLCDRPTSAPWHTALHSLRLLPWGNALDQMRDNQWFTQIQPHDLYSV
ncbi:MAG: hypothetical protein RMX98_034900 [Nostoc sp. DedQUE02]|nr:hypothetical protein [Nostoc sp. DedQUE02]